MHFPYQKAIFSFRQLEHRGGGCKPRFGGQLKGVYKWECMGGWLYPATLCPVTGNIRQLTAGEGGVSLDAVFACAGAASQWEKDLE